MHMFILYMGCICKHTCAHKYKEGLVLFILLILFDCVRTHSSLATNCYEEFVGSNNIHLQYGILAKLA